MPDALLDTNVIVSALDDRHVHYAPSIALFAGKRRFCVAAHSYAEVFVTLTRRDERSPFRLPPGDVTAALESVAANTQLVGMTPSQTFDAVRSYAAAGGIGPRLYDYLIGRAATHAHVSAIVTWNTKHFRSLFPDLIVENPADYLTRIGTH